MKTFKHIHFMGISGVGMSAIALVLHQRGYTISGCDLNTNTSNCQRLIKEGCIIFQDHCSSGCFDPSIDTLVYTTIIEQTHEELVRARKHGITCLHRSEILGLLTEQHNTIAVAGSHGKTTTSALISHIFVKAHVDPSIIIGGNISTIEGNARNGSTRTLIIEADESDRSFLNFTTHTAIITNIDFEHLETYSDIRDVQETFFKFTQKIVPHGTLICCGDDNYVTEIIERTHRSHITYGYNENNTARISHAKCFANHSLFTITYKNVTYSDIKVSLTGNHNILNSTAAFITGLLYGISEIDIKSALETFPGVDRRFTFKGKTIAGANVFDDYGHHPKEIAATLDIAHNKPYNKLVMVFQPHRYTRTAGLWNEFLDFFTHAHLDELIITDLHAAFETPIDTITSKRFVKELQDRHPRFPVTYIPLDSQFQALAQKIHECSSLNDLILLQGAGKITALAEHLIDK